MDKQAAVIVPFYKSALTRNESVALEQCFKVLSGHPIIAIKPESLTLPTAAAPYKFSGEISFNDKFFRSVEGYNELMLSELFYGSFLDYEYILIYQLDAFVFKDELNYWCSQDIDYVGAPWIKPHGHADFIKAIKSRLQYYFHTRYNVYKNGMPSDKQFENKAGNGGFSLRRTKKFYDLCRSQNEKIALYNSSQHHLFNEDIFWSVEVNRKRKALNIPNWKTALKFSIEFSPERALAINQGELPFGCHAWDMFPDFWRPIFARYGYVI